MPNLLKRALWLIPVLCGSVLGQGVTILPKTTLLPKTTVFPGAAGTSSVVTQVGSINAAGGNGPFSTTLTGNVAIGDAVVVGCGSTTTGITITSFTGTSGTLTFTNSGTNHLSSGNVVDLLGFTGGNTGLNAQLVTVLSAGLSSTTFEAVVTGSGYSTGTGTGLNTINLAISDSGSNTYTFPTANGANSTQEYYDTTQGFWVAFATATATAALTSGTSTVTYTNAIFGQGTCVIWDITNPGGTLLDKAVGHTATFGTTVTSGSTGTLTTQPEIVFGLFIANTGGGSAFSAYGNVIGSAASSGANLSATGYMLVMEQRRATATTSGTAAYTVSANVTGITQAFSIESN